MDRWRGAWAPVVGYVVALLAQAESEPADLGQLIARDRGTRGDV